MATHHVVPKGGCDDLDHDRPGKRRGLGDLVETEVAGSVEDEALHGAGGVWHEDYSVVYRRRDLVCANARQSVLVVEENREKGVAGAGRGAREF